MNGRLTPSIRGGAVLGVLASWLCLSHCSAHEPTGSSNRGGSANAGAGGSASGASGSSSSGAGGGYGQGGAQSGGAGGAFSNGGSAGSFGTGGTSGSGSGFGGASGAGSGTGGASGGSSGAGASGSGGSAGSGGTGVSNPPFILGADISSVQEAVDQGAVYIDTDGQQKNIIDLLKNHGFNYIRLRAFVDPGAPYGYAAGTGSQCSKAENYCDKAHTIEFAQEIKAKGMGFLLDLHYSDTWADPGKQIIPQAWRNLGSISAMASALKAYTKDMVSSLIAAGARPDMVQVGNEITPGMLIHVPNAATDCWGNNSSVTTPNGSTGNWDNLATLLKAGIEGVREVDGSIKVMLHIENTDHLQGVRDWVSSARSRGVDFDVLGLSCYTEWQGPPNTWRTTFQTMANEFPELSFVVAEYNPERTAANEIMADLPDGRGLGTFFWEPTMSGAWGPSLFMVEGNTHTALPSAFAEFDQIATSLGLLP